MRLKVHHEIIADFEGSASFVSRSLRMTPRTFDGQYVRAWRIDVDHDCRQDRGTDAFGNIVHDIALMGPLAGIAIIADGEVEVDDTAGVLTTGHIDRVPPGVFLRETPLTTATPVIVELARAAQADGGGSALDSCHALMRQLHADIEPIEADRAELSGVTARTAADCIEAGRGTAVDMAHLFITGARALGVPTRFVSGYVYDPERGAGVASAWAEAMIAGLGWVGFDIGANRCPTDTYIRIATGIDQSSGAWMRGFDRGPADVDIIVSTTISQIGA